MIDERMLAMRNDTGMAALPFMEKLRHAVAYFCVFEVGDVLSGPTSAVLMYWLDEMGTCRRFAYSVDHELFFPFLGDGDAIFDRWFKASKVAGRLNDPEVPDDIEALFRARHSDYIANGSPLLDFEEAIRCEEIESIFGTVRASEVLALESDVVPRTIDGRCYRVLIRTREGECKDLCWMGSETGERLGNLCNTLLSQAWKRGSERIAEQSHALGRI